MTKSSLQVSKLSKFLSYVLGRRPDEFGIVPDADGFVAIKELLQTLHEEQGWRHIRLTHLHDALITQTPPAIVIEGNRIGAVEKSLLPLAAQPEGFPKLLYIAIRSRSYPVALDKGLSPTYAPHLILSMDKTMAMRIGRRHDNNPTLLTVQVADCLERGTCFKQYGRLLFLADRIYTGTFSGPPLPKEKTDASASNTSIKIQSVKTPGSYFPNINPTEAIKQHNPPGSRRREPEWKKARRQARKHKAHLNKA